MNVFWIFAALMLLIPSAYLAPAILGKSKRRDQDRQQQNVVIAKEQLRLLETDREAGRISESEFEQTRSEIERALHHDRREGRRHDQGGRPPANGGVVRPAQTISREPSE